MNIPYCGIAPTPAELWTRWNLDPVLLLILFAWLAWTWTRIGTSSSDSRRRARFVQGWFALTLGLIAPICSLSVALFAARISQHMWLALVAAPLLAASGLLDGAKWLQRLRTPLSAALLFALALWAWHLPAVYVATFTSDLVYWLMHVTLTGSAVLLWDALMSSRSSGFVARILAAFGTLLQMGLLGALITLAPRLLYSPHAATASVWGLTPLEDQQLGGLIMWVPGGIALTVFALLLVARMLRSDLAADAYLSDVRRS